MVKLSQNKLQNKTINLLSYIFSAHTHILYPWVSILSISYFLETDIREQHKCEKRTQKCVDNTVNDLCHEILWKTLSFSYLSFFAKAETKKCRYALAKALVFANSWCEFWMLQYAQLKMWWLFNFIFSVRRWQWTAFQLVVA